MYTSLSGSTPGLQLGVLYLLSPVTIKCGVVEIDVKGDTLASVKTLPGKEAEEPTSMTEILNANGEGKPNVSIFYNEAGTSVKAKLEANFGTGFKEAAEEVTEEVTTHALEGKMFTVTGRGEGGAEEKKNRRNSPRNF